VVFAQACCCNKTTSFSVVNIALQAARPVAHKLSRESAWEPLIFDVEVRPWIWIHVTPGRGT
jgi:hypothetical protein